MRQPGTHNEKQMGKFKVNVSGEEQSTTPHITHIYPYPQPSNLQADTRP